MGIYDANPSAPGYAEAIRAALQAQGMGMPQQGPQMAPGGAQAGAVDPATVQSMLALQGQAPAQASIQRQLAQAQAMRTRGLSQADLIRQQGQKGLEQRTFGNGQVAAPNWAGAIANVFAMKKAGDMEKAIAEEARGQEREVANKEGALGTARQDALRRYFENLSTPGAQRMPTSGGYDGGVM